jgi:hypothetical protein
MRPSGVRAIIVFSKSLPIRLGAVRALRLDFARRNRIDPDFLRPQLRGQSACYGVYRAFRP